MGAIAPMQPRFSDVRPSIGGCVGLRDRKYRGTRPPHSGEYRGAHSHWPTSEHTFRTQSEHVALRKCPPDVAHAQILLLARDGQVTTRYVLDERRGARACGAQQQDPAHGGRAARIRGTKNAAHQRAVREWTGERPDASVFQAETLPELRLMPIAELMAATGLSEHYCSLIRLGKKTPAPPPLASIYAGRAIPVSRCLAHSADNPDPRPFRNLRELAECSLETAGSRSLRKAFRTPPPFKPQ
jgi:hypothetical protein